MSEEKDGLSNGRRRFLLTTTSVVGAVGVVGVATPFIRSWNPSAKAKAAGAPVTVSIEKLEPGQQIIVEWRGKPVFIVRRTQNMLDNLSKISGRLRDPDSKKSEQPAYATNEFRAIRKDILVLVGLCTHLGCSPKFMPEVRAMEFDSEWSGGYHCPCHGSKFDLAGRVFKGVPAPTNLVIPPHNYIDENVLVIGIDGEAV